jgi:hypothetical protein
MAFRTMNFPRFEKVISIQNLLVFLFCGAVVGETLALSMVITRLGPAVVGKLYLVNAVILLLIPPLFSRHIDRVDRGRLLGWLLQGTFILLTLILFIYQVFFRYQIVANGVLTILYPVAYLSKTILFLTFWTFLNDIYTIQEAKRKFPVIAAWGFTGSLAGVMIARLLLAVVSIRIIIVLWIFVYICAWVFARKLGVKYSKRLRPVEDIPLARKAVFGIGDLLEIRLVRIMSLFYFLTFIAVFWVDFLFWKRCYEWFATAEHVASFQFSFYIGHAALTIVLLRFALPPVIARLGFTRVLYGLPLMLLLGGIVLLTAGMLHAPKVQFVLFIVVQFFRYIFFEITFAPLYQLFFAAIVKERRGRTKTFLEGVVKPLAILSSGIVLVAGITATVPLALLVVLCGMVLWLLVYNIRKVYRATMMSESRTSPGIEELIEEAGQKEDERLYVLINRYAVAEEVDLRKVAVHLLRQTGTVQSFETMVRMYALEPETSIRELIASSMEGFYGYTSRPFIERLLDEKDPRIRANAIGALNSMHCNWKRHLTPRIGPLLFENNQRIQIEAARFLWMNGSIPDQCSVQNFLKSLLDSSDTGRKSAGIYLAGTLKTEGWESVLSANLTTASLQVFTKSVDVLLKSGTETVQLQTLKAVDTLSRKHISITGETIDRIGIPLMGTLISFLSDVHSRRMCFEMVRCLIRLVDTRRQTDSRIKLPLQTAKVISDWITGELESVYLEALVFAGVRNNPKISGVQWEVLETAIRERQSRICEWALAAVLLIDTRGEHNWRFVELDIYNQARREELVEVFESVGQEKVGTLVVGLLKMESWENLARLGKGYFHFNENAIPDIFAWFLRSENRLIVLSALYTIEKNNIEYRSNPEIIGVLRMLSYNKNDLVASAATDLIEFAHDGRTRRGKAFQLLEGVLLFKGMRLFNGIGADKLLHLVEIARLVVFHKEEMISMQGRVSDQMYIVKSGSMRIETRKNGIAETLSRIGAGETYGEIGLFSKAVRGASAIADEYSEVYIIKGADIKRLVKEVPEIAFNFLETLSQRLVKDGVEIE